MLVKFTWLVPGLPITASFIVALLLVSFNRTMNRLTKPVSYFIILSLFLSETISFILFEKKSYGVSLIFGDFKFLGNNLQLYVDSQSLLFSTFIGIVFLLAMIISFIKLKRKNGYVRYFIFLGFLSGLVYLFSFSGSFFHEFIDPLVSYLEKTVISSV